MSRKTGPTVDRRQELADTLAAGVAELVTSDGWLDYLAVQSKFPRFSFRNTMLILAQRPDATRVMAYGNADRKTGWFSVGRHVVTGEKAFYIWEPCRYKTTDPDTGSEASEIRGFKPGARFDVSQTDGDPLPEPVTLLAGEDEQGHLPRLVKVAESHGYPVSFVPEIADHPNANGVTRFASDTRAAGIEIATDGRSPLMQCKTMAHELGHALLHKPGPDRPDSRDQLELEAESVAYITAGSLGYDTSAYSFGYLACWADSDPDLVREVLTASGSRIQSATRTILDALAGEVPE